MNAAAIRATLAAHYAFIRRYPYVVPEAVARDGMGSNRADLLVATSEGYTMEFEIKVSVSDLKADFAKPKHERLVAFWKTPARSLFDMNGIPNEFYFAVPVKLRDKAKLIVDEHYPYAGLVLVAGKDPRKGIQQIRTPYQFTAHPRMQTETLNRMMSYAVARLLRGAA